MHHAVSACTLAVTGIEPRLEATRDRSGSSNLYATARSSLRRRRTRISSQYHQVRFGRDAAAIVGICKAVVEADDAARAAGHTRDVSAD